MIITIEDTGYVDNDFSPSDTPFTAYGSITSTQYELGEFKAVSPIKLKLDTVNFGGSSNIQDNLSLSGFNSSLTRTSTSVPKLSLGVSIIKPTEFINTGEAYAKDLPDLKQLVLMWMSKGHKDIYIDEETNAGAGSLLSMYWLINLFGATDDGNTLSAKHLNVLIDSITMNEGARGNIIPLQISCRIMWQ